MTAGTWTIVVAGGSGRRFGRAKQFEPLGAHSVLGWSAATAAAVSDGVVVVVPAEAIDTEVVQRAVSEARSVGAPDLAVVAVPGGETRAGSVRAGLEAVPADATRIAVHDAARPFAGPQVFAAAFAALDDGAVAVVPGVDVTDSVRRRDGGAVDRTELVAVQTPQVFDAEVLRSAHRNAPEASDDATLVESEGHDVVVIDGDPRAFKITGPDDLLRAEALVDAGRVGWPVAEASRG